MDELGSRNICFELFLILSSDICSGWLFIQMLILHVLVADKVRDHRELTKCLQERKVLYHLWQFFFAPVTTG